MAGKLSLSIAINLLTENFKKGANTVKNGFRSMHAQVLTLAAALGFAGVSLSNLVSEMIRIARETGKAVTALKNVSGSTAQFASNLRFTTNLAKRYGAYVNDITGNFAKFTAAASVAGMAMDSQRKLFESLSRASAAFGLSADETNGMFLAVTQMMGKGKIQAEELRGQLGERLPIAMQAMAKAAGTTVAGLDDIMKKGQLLSAEVLPGFADALNAMIPNVDTDNLETSLNRLKNTFQEITNSAGVQGKYKALIDGLTGLLQGLAANVNNVFIGIVAAIVFVIGRGLTQLYGSIRTTQESILRSHERCQAQALAATERKLLAEQNLERAKANYVKATEAELLAAKIEMKKAEIALKAATTRETKALEAAEAAATKATLLKSQGLFASTKNFIVTGVKQIGNALRAAWASLGFAAILSGLAALFGYLKNIYDEAKRVRNVFNEYKKSTLTISSPVEKTQLEALKGIAEDTTRTIKDRSKAWAELASRMNVTQKKNETELEFHKRINGEIAKRIKLIEDTAKADFYATKKVEAEDKFKALQKELGIQDMDTMGTEYLMQQMAAYGKTGSKKSQVDGLHRYYQEIWDTNGKFVKGYENKLIEMSGYWEVMADATREMEDATTGLLNNDSRGISQPLTDANQKKTPLQQAEEAYTRKIRELEARREVEKMSIAEYNKSLDELNRNALIDARASGDKQILESEYYKKLQSAVNNLNYTDEQRTQEEFLATKKEYAKAVAKLKNQLDNGVISQKKYDDDLNSLIETTLLAAGSLAGIGEAGKEFIKALHDARGKLQTVDIPQYQGRNTTFDYKKNDLEKMRANRDARQGYVDTLKGKLGGDADEVEEKLKAAKGNLEVLKKEYSNLAPELIEALNDALGRVTTLDEALKIAEVKNDVKDLTKQLNEGMYSGIKNIVSGADRLVSSFSNLSEVMNDENATGWERFMAVWETMVNTADSIISIIETIKNLSELSKQLAEAKAQEQELDSKRAETHLANAAAIQAEAAANTELAASIELLKNTKGEASAADDVQAQKTAANTESNLATVKNAVSTGIALNEAAADSKVQTASKEVAANTAAGASEAGKGAAKLPFPWNIVAIGGAIAAALAAFAVIPKFASGGIVHGKPSGDLNVARVNGGEMILNGHQQATLFQIANGKGIRTNSVSGKVEFELRYDRLVGVLKNGNQKQGRGR